MGPIVNALTIDVEDYFQVSAFEPYIHRDTWSRRECRVEHNVERIMRLLEDHRTHATFFTLGWIAERYPGLVRAIAGSGHEIASHGFSHRRATEQDRASFTADITRSKQLLEDIAGVQVMGYRAPSFSINERNKWAFECIEGAGYRYSSSIYPVRHDHYGMPDAPRFAHKVTEQLLEVPVSTVRFLKRNWPAGGGGYFRLLPYTTSRWLLKHVNSGDGKPAVFYIHPWEIDPEQPRVSQAGLKTRFRHYLNLKRTETRLKRLLADFCWGRIDDVILRRSGRGSVADAGPRRAHEVAPS